MYTQISIQVMFIYAALNHKQSQSATHAHRWQIFTASPDLNPQEGKEKLKKNLEKGPQMGEFPFQDDQAATDAKWATFDSILYYTMLIKML